MGEYETLRCPHLLCADLFVIVKGNGAYFLAALDLGVRGCCLLTRPLGVVGVRGGVRCCVLLLTLVGVRCS